MKKTILFAVMMMAVSGAQAQLSVSHDGETYCKRLYSSFSNTNYGNWTLTGISSTLQNIGEIQGEAINGYVFASSNDNVSTRIAIGVRGRADNAFGRNYGVYGECIPITGNLNYGAGIYGTYKSTPKVLSDNYAGYFDGRVGISEGLNVTGYIRLNGSLLSPTPPVNKGVGGTSITEKGSNPMADRLTDLQIESFFYERPQQEYAETISEEDDILSQEENPSSELERAIFVRKHYGLNADQLEEVFPDLVYENADGSKSINYVEMVPILVQAINELKSELDELKSNGGEVKKAQTRATNANEMGDNLVMLSLGQNKPNPFSTTTSIDVTIPDDVQKAFIYVYDLQGKKVDQVDITARGKQTIQLNATTLSDGMYLYSLIADGRVVETRRMIVEK